MESLEKMKNFVLKNVVSIASISFAIIVLAFSVLYVYFHKCKECPICESSVRKKKKFTNKDVEVYIDMVEKLLGANPGTMSFISTLIGGYNE